LICDKNLILEMDGSGNVIEIDDGVIGIGSGGAYAECKTINYVRCCKSINRFRIIYI
jgi:ATP-dependent protease HslVU (ClpYQ) peptidase subunit